MNFNILGHTSDHGNHPEAYAALAAVREQKEQKANNIRQDKAELLAQFAIDGTVKPDDAQLAGQIAAEKHTATHQIPVEDLSAGPLEVPVEVK